jgi:hypothetical protein
MGASATMATYLAGSGGKASSGVGDVLMDGSDGGWSLRLSASAGQAGSGGAAPSGGGFTNGPRTTAAGVAGSAHGGGGSGALTTAAAQIGGDGAAGCIRVWEFA